MASTARSSYGRLPATPAVAAVVRRRSCRSKMNSDRWCRSGCSVSKRMTESALISALMCSRLTTMADDCRRHAHGCRVSDQDEAGWVGTGNGNVPARGWPASGYESCQSAACNPTRQRRISVVVTKRVSVSARTTRRSRGWRLWMAHRSAL